MAKQRILGLDLGTASIGFALIDYDREVHEGEIVRMGVRIFPETRDAKTATPKNQHRRAKRMVRRQLRRRKERRRNLNEYLYSIGLLPKFGTAEWHSVMKLNPYTLRRNGISCELEKFELGRAIYHLAKRRHFLGKDLVADEDFGDESEDGQTIEDRGRLQKELADTGFTLGEWLAQLPPEERKRNKLASRVNVMDEFSRLVDHQSTYPSYAELKLSEHKHQIHEHIFHQRPVFWRKNTLGRCPYEPDGQLCPSGSWHAQQKKMLEVINNLSIEGNKERLSDEERAAILRAVKSKTGLTWAQVRRALKPIYEARGQDGFETLIKFNLELGELKKIPVNRLELELREIFGKGWLDHPSKDRIREGIHNDLFECDYHEIGNQRIEIRRKEERTQKRSELAVALQSKYDILPEEARKLSELQLGTGWEPYSIDAMRVFLEMLEKGHRMGDLINKPEFEQWRNENFPNQVRRTYPEYARLPTPKDSAEQKRLNEIRNPTVVRTQNELRKVVNNLLDEYGKPDLIRVELTRDLRVSRKDRKKIQANISKNEKLRSRAKDDLEKHGVPNPSRTDIEKWILWEECGHECPYTGRMISFDALFGSNPSFEIEHIWPRSRSFDDSLANKTLCLASVNREKGNRIPHEYLGDDATKWHHVKNRVESMRGRTDGMSRKKARNFLAKEIPDDFTNRQLVDTSYAAREARESLSRLWSDDENRSRVTVQTVSGQATSRIRYLWGMNDILSEGDFKTRDDHRHHAIDALVVACIYPGITQSLSSYWRTVEERRSSPLTKPWPEFRNDAERHIDSVIVSHKVQRKVSGALHEETIYGKTSNVDSSGSSGKFAQFVTRKPVEQLTAKEKNANPAWDQEGEGIRDASVREKVQQMTESKEPDASIDRVVRRVRILKKRDANLLQKVTTGYAEVGSNHHMVIYRNDDGEVVYKTVSLFDAAKRMRRGKPIVDTSLIGHQFLNSLSIGESIRIIDGDRQGIWVINQIRGNGQVVLSLHNISRKENSDYWRPRAHLLVTKYQFRKISIDPIGRVRDAND